MDRLCSTKIENKHEIVTSITYNTYENNQFADQILKVGDGNAGQLNNRDDFINVPPDMLIPYSEDFLKL